MWNHKMREAPEDCEILAVFNETCPIKGIKYKSYRVIIWDELEGDGWLDANELYPIESNPIGWMAIPEPTEC